MNVYTSYSSVTERFTFPSAPDAGSVIVSVYYDYDDLLLDNISATLVSGNTYSITINDDTTNSYGIYKIKWAYSVSGSDAFAYSEFKIEDPYIKIEKFLVDFPEYDLPEFIGKFDMAEKTARRIIDTYTGQNFQFVNNKSRKFDGNGKGQIHLMDRLVSFSSVFIDESDYTDKVTLDLRSRYYIKLIDQFPYPDSRRDDLVPAIFPKKTIVDVTGDWGWINVPWEIEQAAELLVVDLLDDVRREHYRYGITRLEQGNNRLEFDRTIYNSTGNIDVDTLLMDYMYWTMDYVV